MGEGAIFTSYLSDEGLISKMYKELKKFNNNSTSQLRSKEACKGLEWTSFERRNANGHQSVAPCPSGEKLQEARGSGLAQWGWWRPGWEHTRGWRSHCLLSLDTSDFQNNNYFKKQWPINTWKMVSLATGEVLNKTTVSHCFTPMRMTIIPKSA